MSAAIRSAAFAASSLRRAGGAAVARAASMQVASTMSAGIFANQVRKGCSLCLNRCDGTSRVAANPSSAECKAAMTGRENFHAGASGGEDCGWFFKLLHHF
jgi:hypothetical protein